MHSLNNLKYTIPLGIFAIGSYISYRKGSESAANFKEATIAQIEYAAELQDNPISNQTYWKGKIGKVINSGPSLLDEKISVDFLSTGSLIGLHIGLGMLSTPYAILPAVIYVPSTAAIFYAERGRSAEFFDVIQGLYTPECSVDSFKSTLAAASNVGISKNPNEYAQYISTLYKIEDVTNIVQFGTVVGGLWTAYSQVTGTDAKVSDTSKTISDSQDSDSSSTSSDSDTVGDPKLSTTNSDPNYVESSTKGAIVPNTTPLPSNTGILASASGYFATVASKAHDLAGSAYEKIEVVGEYVHDKLGITARDIKAAVSAIGVTKAFVSAYSMFSNSSLEIGLVRERSEAVTEYVLAREEVRKLVMEDFLQLRFEACSAENSKINDDFLDVYTTASCSEGNVFTNLLSGKDVCMFTNPEL